MTRKGQETSRAAKKAAGQPLPQPAAFPRRVLLAEDNPINAKVAGTYLGRRGHDAVMAANGREALDLLSRQAFDLVLMDLEMPELDGLETTRRLRAGQAGPVNRDIPVIAMTAHTLNGVMERCLAAGMTAYLPKPLNFQELDALLDRLPGRVQDLDQTLEPDDVPDLDSEAALTRLGGDQELLREIQDEFLRQYPRKLRSIALCRDRENWEEAALAAHSLKNIAGAVGAEASRRLAGRLEESLRQADVLSTHDTMAALQKSLGQASQALLAQLGPPSCPSATPV